MSRCKRVSQREIRRRSNQREAQWEKDHPEWAIRREQMMEQDRERDRHPRGRIEWREV